MFSMDVLRPKRTRMIDKHFEIDVSLKEFWKSHFNIADAVFLITSAWKEVTLRCLCAAWRPLWPECVLQRDFEGFEEAVVHEIVSLGNSMGLEVDDVEELVEEHSKELSTEELLELHKEENETLKRSLTSEESGKDEDKEESHIIPAKDLKDVFFCWSKLSKLARIIILMLVLWKRPSVCLMTL
ncbi:Tigger transposable element-derived protein 1-like 127 [Homarus americanus]|uniref:Tigger transposable element-derived protein 1-like 127 n=1 Tax=Homarus americanus TaxID=6706 RepID=A0A8J5JDI6_HOMAM|nr:Tigger transposable element-derived protein 1-like 127 [Homarus americanus]